MTIDKNIAPYFDDFRSDSGFHQILFKPGYAVQARELTQSQSILRDQIAKFGDHMFKHGSVVLPGNVTYDLNICAVKLTTTPSNLHVYAGGTVVGTSGLKARVKAVAAPTVDDANTTLFVSYFNTGTNGERVFGENEILSLTNPLGNVTATATTVAVEASTGAAMTFINDGVFYVNGSFVEINKQSIVISKYSAVPNCMVLLKIDQNIVTSDIDATLLDPAQGSYNYAAPGADRIKIVLTLTSLELGTETGADYIELMRFDNGKIQEFSRYPKYNELDKNLARRTYDESGDYIANGLKLTVHESIKKAFNGGKLVNGSQDDYAIEVSAGKAYINGFESEGLYPQILTAPKGRSAIPNHIKGKSISIAPNFGQYLFVTNLKSLPDFSNRSTVNIFNSIATNGTATQIGTATVVAIDLHEANSTEATNIYKLYVTGIIATGDLNTIGSIKFTGGSADVLHKLTVPVAGGSFAAGELVTFGTATATVTKWVPDSSTLYVTKHSAANIPAMGVRITGGTSGVNGVINASGFTESNEISSPIIKLPIDATYKIRANVGTTASPVYSPNITYKVFKEISITLSNNAGSYTISGGTIDPIELSNAIVTSSSGTWPNSRLSVSGDGLTISYAGTGTNGEIIKIICAVTKTNVSNRNKTLTQQSDAALVSNNTVQLTRGDVHRLISVVSTVDGDVTSRYRLNNGQTDYAYLKGSLILVGTKPTGTLTATYEYFIHSGTGDYFSVDSYVNSGLTDYYTSILPYSSRADNTVYDLRNCLDFRPKFDAVNTPIDMPIIDSRITTTVQYYVPRIDAVVLNKSGEAYMEYGVPAEVPRAPSQTAETIQLGTIVVPAYTYAISDMQVFPSRYKGFKMRDILKLEDRILNIEQYSLLTQTESSLINNDIIDASTGLSRYKSGYLVETFENAEIIGDITSKEFVASYVGGLLMPAMERFSVELEYVSTTGTVATNNTNKNKTVTMPYSNSVFAQQNRSTRISNINPFAVFSWKGEMTLVPSVDNFTIMNILPPVFEVINNVVVQSVTIDVPRYWAYQPEIGSVVSFAPLPQAWADGGYKSSFEVTRAALNWHVNNDVDDSMNGGRNDPNPANWWWIP